MRSDTERAGQPRQQAGFPGAPAILTLDPVCGQLRLHLVPKVAVDDGVVFARVALVLVDDLAQVDAVLKHMIDGATRQRDTARAPAGLVVPDLADDTVRIELVLQGSNGAELRIAPVNAEPSSA